MGSWELNQNKNANNNVDVMYKIWLGRWFVVQTFEGDEAELLQDIREIRELLTEGNLDKGEGV
jgi:hypothetical protein